jgi:4-alpha-glucanotransferase
VAVVVRPSQWGRRGRAAAERDIAIMGDVPIFVAFDSADTWADQDLLPSRRRGAPDGDGRRAARLLLGHRAAVGQPRCTAGSATRKRGFAWWMARVKRSIEIVDVLRIDHFRGFEAYWEIPADEPTAVKGRWVKGAGQPLFDALKRGAGELPIVAEDLGVITPAVERLRDENHLPGMKVLQFAFAADAADPYLPHNYGTNCGRVHRHPRQRHHRRLVRPGPGVASATWCAATWRATAATWPGTCGARPEVGGRHAIAPLQDLMGFGSEARMNTPGAPSGNWGWRFDWEDLPFWLARSCSTWPNIYGRLPARGRGRHPYRQSVRTTRAEPGA